MKSGAVKILRYYRGKLNAAKISQKQRQLMRSRKKQRACQSQISRAFAWLGYSGKGGADLMSRTDFARLSR